MAAQQGTAIEETSIKLIEICICPKRNQNQKDFSLKNDPIILSHTYFRLNLI